MTSGDESGDEEIIAGTSINRKAYKRILSSGDENPEKDEQKAAKKDINDHSDWDSECLLPKPCTSSKTKSTKRKSIKQNI